ncbi:hypothetical protein [Paraflavitalea speifideaquila]|uniref:hypothetical protein n=1 Tax=Paraflavitalea speifideaquila TaxID=3076558 RepID=UPI0028E6CDC6|nr:hypothetical protein [Paraflavitalea speifideiaquila]
MFYCKSFTVSLLLLILMGSTAAQTRTDKKLQQKITELVQAQGVRGVVGIYVKTCERVKKPPFSPIPFFQRPA